MTEALTWMIVAAGWAALAAMLALALWALWHDD